MNQLRQLLAELYRKKIIIEMCIRDRYRVDYDECFEAKFEFITIPVMNNYERVLNMNFGDWKKFIIGTSEHGTVFFDTEKSYKKYIEDLSLIHIFHLPFSNMAPDWPRC